MRIPTHAEYSHAQAALAAYREFSKPYLQRNGWTVIPADAPRPVFEGVELTTDAINVCSTNVELFEFNRDRPDKLSAYVTFPRNSVTTWTGEEIGIVIDKGHWNRNNFGARWRTVKMRSDWGDLYSGREYDSRQLVNFKRLVHA